MHPKEAASRRDFTINTLMMEPVTNDILDFYDGLKHIKERRLVATSDKFAEDPLRVLRGMQFAARFGMAMDNDTIKMCQHLSCEFEYLTIERIFGEWYKMVTKGSYIRMGMDVLIQTGWIKHFPTWNRFYAENQPLFESNIIAAERLIIYCEEQNIVDYDRAVLVFATLLNEWDMAGEDYALSEIGCFPEITARVHKLLDVDFPSFTIAGVRQQAFKMVPATIREFLIIQASRGMASSYATALETMAQQGGCLNGSLPPVLSGKHLIEIGRKPGPEFGKILKEAYQAQMHGAFTDSSGAINWVKEKGC
jgi:tRNA nucleotidyltransferase (CCA-adding enzyme)